MSIAIREKITNAISCKKKFRRVSPIEMTGDEMKSLTRNSLSRGSVNDLSDQNH